MNFEEIVVKMVESCDPHIGVVYQEVLEMFKEHQLPLDSYDERHVNCIQVAHSVVQMESKNVEKFSPDFQMFWSTWLTYEAIIKFIEQEIENG